MYNIFIIHAWNHYSDYDGLVNMLDTVSGFKWHNNSLSKMGDPDNGSRNSDAPMVKGLISDRINASGCVLVILGEYVQRQWIRTEMDIAREYNKPIIGILINGRKSIPDEVKDRLDTAVEYEASSIVDAIKRLCRG
jgi:hypothetical protein